MFFFIFSLIEAVNALATLCYGRTRRKCRVQKEYVNVVKIGNEKDIEVYRACGIYQQIFLGEKKTENWKFKIAT